MSRPTKDEIERAYIEALVAGNDPGANHVRQLRFDVEVGTHLPLEQFADILAVSCLDYAQLGYRAGWFDVRDFDMIEDPSSGLYSSGYIGIRCPDGFIYVDANIDNGACTFNSFMTMVCEKLSRMVGVELDGKHRDVHVWWADWHKHEKIKEALASPRGYEAYCSGVPIDDIIA